MKSRHFSLLLAVVALASATTGTWLGLRDTRQLQAPADGQSPAAMGLPFPGRDGAMPTSTNQPPYPLQLLRLTRGLQRLDATAPYPLTAEQARAMLAVLQPLRGKTPLPQDASRTAVRKLKLLLTIEQRTAIAEQATRRSSPPPGGMAGPPPGARIPGAVGISEACYTFLARVAAGH